MDIEKAIAKRNALAKQIRQGKAQVTPEYVALDNAISAALAPPIVKRTSIVQLEAFEWAWKGDAKQIG